MNDWFMNSLFNVVESLGYMSSIYKDIIHPVNSTSLPMLRSSHVIIAIVHFHCGFSIMTFWLTRCCIISWWCKRPFGILKNISRVSNSAFINLYPECENRLFGHLFIHDLRDRTLKDRPLRVMSVGYRYQVSHSYVLQLNQFPHLKWCIWAT